MSEEVLSELFENAVEGALYERRMKKALHSSRFDFEEGRFYSSREELLSAVEEKRKNRGIYYNVSSSN